GTEPGCGTGASSSYRQSFFIGETNMRSCFSSGAWSRLLDRLGAMAGMAHRRRIRPDAGRRSLFRLETLEERAVPTTAPVAAPDFADTDGRNPVRVAVLANDSALGGHSHIAVGTLTLTDTPSHGRVTLNRITGRFTYTADAGFEGTDTFAYTFRDKKGVLSNPATVTIQVHLPHAIDDFADTDGTNPVTVAVLDNDSDPDGHA